MPASPAARLPHPQLALSHPVSDDRPPDSPAQANALAVSSRTARRMLRHPLAPFQDPCSPRATPSQVRWAQPRISDRIRCCFRGARYTPSSLAPASAQNRQRPPATWLHNAYQLLLLTWPLSILASSLDHLPSMGSVAPSRAVHASSSLDPSSPDPSTAHLLTCASHLSLLLPFWQLQRDPV